MLNIEFWAKMGFSPYIKLSPSFVKLLFEMVLLFPHRHKVHFFNFILVHFLPCAPLLPPLLPSSLFRGHSLNFVSLNPSPTNRPL